MTPRTTASGTTTAAAIHPLCGVDLEADLAAGPFVAIEVLPAPLVVWILVPVDTTAA